MRGFRRGAGPSAGTALLAAACFLATGCAGGDVDLERMLEQPRYDIYEESGFFPDRKVLQHPPEGTVPRERILDRPLRTGGDAAGGQLARVPLPVTAGLLALGRSRFDIFCAACHGAGGYGGSVVAMNMQARRPPSLRTPEMRARPPGNLYRVIREGHGRMPSYAAELGVKERWAVVAYVQELQRRPAVSAAEIADSLAAEELRARDTLATAGAEHPAHPALPSSSGVAEAAP